MNSLASSSVSFVRFALPPSSACSSLRRATSCAWARRRLKHYAFQELGSKDCECKFISGWGPGGQKVNKAQNAVQLRHLPTNCIVKVHESRSADENVKLARERLRLAVDRHLNGENSYEAQLKRIQREHETKVNRRREKSRELKSSFSGAEQEGPESKEK